MISRARSRPKKAAAKRRRAKKRRPRPVELPEEQGETVALLHEREVHAETGPVLSGGDIDADWQRAYSSGEEAVAGSVPTPDQDIVDEIGRALGVEQPDGELRTSQEILEGRRRHYWHLEREAEREDEP